MSLEPPENRDLSKNKSHNYRKYCSINNFKFAQDLATSPLLTAVGDTQTLCEQYNNELSVIIDNHAPLIRRTVNVRPRQPWRTDEVLSTRRQAERKWRHPRLHVHRHIYTDLRDAFKKTIAHAKSSYYCGEIASYSKDSKRMFAVAKDLMGCSKQPSLPKFDGCPVALSERFAAYFKGKITRLSGNQVSTQTQPRPPRSNNSDCCLVTESLRGYELTTVAEIGK